jgi:hypothetical protein
MPGLAAHRFRPLCENARILIASGPSLEPNKNDNQGSPAHEGRSAGGVASRGSRPYA